MSDILSKFGEEVSVEVRDYTHKQILNSLEKGGSAEHRLKMFEFMNSLDKDQKNALKWILLYVTDTTLHYFLWMIEQSDDFDLVYKAENKMISLKEVSDGLCGELYSEDGWIERFSKYPPTIK